ncbi:hypothetical protein O1611_g7724 [Lasiodiplodia mahajangana]|uniref:Uncharacterized protein n=1 Tax=Lasiodiplodia mahajangana TaxID=1108764 RepID=A0ACC2JEL9_9PEZI|nr:hypothetical protein O1611_g7724 [Lasiodiplodia mahajangana]
MTTHVNAQGRPTLAPLWTNYESLGRSSATAFRAAQAPLLSPSPMSPGTLPKPMYPASLDGSTRKKNRALLDVHKTSPSTISSPRPLVPLEGQSPLVSKLEKSLLLVDAISSPSATEGDSGEANARHILRPREEYGNIATADAFVIARSIRRSNSPTADGLRPFWEMDSSKSRLSRRLTLRAIIRPRAQGRNTFLIQRNLDIDELRATTSTGPSDKSHPGASPSKASRKPLPVLAKWSSNTRRPSASPQAERFSRKTPHSPGYDKLIRDPKAVPIHTHYAISCLPALAALLTSGHIHSGDVIYLPVPHAESWPQTVRYVYTGEGELTAAMRENILYLGGRV